MIIYDRDGTITIELRGVTIEVTLEQMSPEQVAAEVAKVLDEPVYWLDRAGNHNEVKP